MHNGVGMNKLASLKRITVLRRHKASLVIDEPAAVSGNGIFAKVLQLLQAMWKNSNACLA